MQLRAGFLIHKLRPELILVALGWSWIFRRGFDVEDIPALHLSSNGTRRTAAPSAAVWLDDHVFSSACNLANPDCPN